MDILLALVPGGGCHRMALQEAAAGGKITDDGMKFLAAAMVMGIGAIGPSLAIGNLVGRAMDALGRNPEAQPVIQTNMILGLAFAEAIGIYALVVAIMIGFVF
jgi:F-type H+-transporting ATPase subunit c